MSGKDTSKNSETDWTRVDSQTDETIDTTDIPPLTDSFFESTRWRAPKERVPVRVRVDPDVLAWFEAQGEAWEDRMAAALRIYAEAHKA